MWGKKEADHEKSLMFHGIIYCLVGLRWGRSISCLDNRP